MQEQQINKLYNESKDCIKASIDKLIRKNQSLDRDELLSEANEIFWRCVQKYDQAKGNFLNLLSTTLYFKLYQKCREMNGEKRVLKSGIWEQKEEYLEDLVFGNKNFEEELATRQESRDNELVEATISNMSEDAQTMTQIIFNPPSHLNKKVEQSKSKRITKENLFAYFRGIGWQRKRILHAFWEIKSGLHHAWV